MTWQRVLRVGGTMLLAGLSAFGAATLVVGVDLGFEAAIMAGIAAFFANVFMIDGLAETKCCAIVAATMNARCEPSSRTRPRPPSTRSRRWTWARHRTVCWAAFKIEAANTRGQDGGLKSRFHVWRRRIGRASPAGTVCSLEACLLIQINRWRVPIALPP